MKYLILDLIETIAEFRIIKCYSTSLFCKKSDCILLYDPQSRISIKYPKEFNSLEYNKLFFHVINYKKETFVEYFSDKSRINWSKRKLVFFQKYQEPPNITQIPIELDLNLIPKEIKKILHLFYCI